MVEVLRITALVLVSIAMCGFAASHILVAGGARSPKWLPTRWGWRRRGAPMSPVSHALFALLLLAFVLVIGILRIDQGIFWVPVIGGHLLIACWVADHLLWSRTGFREG
jgi:glycine/D-amino acid oxidase-like deaminating enzyme